MCSKRHKRAWETRGSEGRTPVPLVPELAHSRAKSPRLFVSRRELRLVEAGQGPRAGIWP